MKIIELNYFLGGGGASRFLVDLSNQFASDKNNEVIAVSVVSSDRKGNDYISFKGDMSPEVKYIPLNNNSGLSWRSLWGVFKLIKNERPDVVHLHASIMLLLLPAIFCKKVRYVHTIHTLVTFQYHEGLVKKIANWLYKSGKVIPVTISHECHETYKECFGRTEDVLINNGRVSLKTTEKLSQVEKELSGIGVNRDAPVFIHVARHHPVKNHERLFKTFQTLSNEGFDFQLIVIGDHYDDYENLYKGHRQIHILGPRTNIGDYMALADYFVLTSDKEGLPLSLLEAMSMGVIPVCTPAGGINDVIRNGDNGYLSEEISDESFYQIVKQILSSKNNISRESIIQEYKEKYSMEICAKHYMDIYAG